MSSSSLFNYTTAYPARAKLISISGLPPNTEPSPQVQESILPCCRTLGEGSLAGNTPALSSHFHGISEWSGWEGIFNGHLVQPTAQGWDTSHWVRLPKAPSNLTLNTSKNGAAPAFLGNVFSCLITPTVKNLFLNLNLPLLAQTCHPLSYCYMLL